MLHENRIGEGHEVIANFRLFLFAPGNLAPLRAAFTSGNVRRFTSIWVEKWVLTTVAIS